MAGFDIPDNDVAFDTDQSIWMSTDIDILTAGFNGVGVVSGCGVTAQGSPDMTVAVAAGTIRIAAGWYVAVASGNATITAANATNPRIDLVTASDTGTKTVTDGTAAANPKAPALPAGHVALALVYVPANDTTIASNQITDKRVILPTRQYDPDTHPPSGLTLYDEFDDSSVDGAWSWDTPPSTVSESEFPGFYYINAGTTNASAARHFTRSFAPGASTAFSVAAKLAPTSQNGNFSTFMGIVVRTSAPASIARVEVYSDGTTTGTKQSRALVDATTGLGAGGEFLGAWRYLLMTRDASDVYKFYVSTTGILWTYLHTVTSSSTVALVGLTFGADTDAVEPRGIVDWFRVYSSVTQKVGA